MNSLESEIKDFLDVVFNEIQEKGVDLEELTLDHIAYQASSKEDYESLREDWLDKGELVSESSVGGRRVGIFKLNKALEVLNIKIKVVELVEPKKSQNVDSGWEHIEMLANESLEKFVEKYPNLEWDTSAIDREIFPMLILKLESGHRIKFPRRGCLDEVQRQENELYEKTVKFVDESYKEKKPHYEQTVYWITKLNPSAPIYLKIAGYAHDIQRAFSKSSTMQPVQESKDGFQDKTLRKEHQEEGAEITKNFLLKNGASALLAEKVYNLILKHEEGGTDEQNTLKDADSISFFECNAKYFVKRFEKEVGSQKVKDKFDWMYNRITSQKAKDFAKPMYEEAVKMLE